MQKVLVLNGSHKQYKSYTMKVTEAFISGLTHNNEEFETDIINLREHKILPCISCFHCWTNTPGECVQEDDMKELLEKYLEADLIIWSTPLYHYGISSIMKNFLERTLPLLLPFIDPEGGDVYGHPYRDQEKMKSKRHMLISTCGLPTQNNNYEGVFAQFDNLFGKDKWEKIICVEGELFGVSQLDVHTAPYLELVRLAGEKYRELNTIPDELKKGLEKPFVEIPTYLKTANLKWGIDDTRFKESDGGLLGWEVFKRIEGAFNPRVRPGLKAVLEIELTDVKECYQLIIKNNHCSLVVNDLQKATTMVKTQLTTLERIVDGSFDLGQAIIDKRFLVNGNFSIINAMMDGLFGNLVFHVEKSKKMIPISFKNTPYWFILTLIPWLFCQMIVDTNPIVAVVLALMMSGFLCAIKKGQELVFFDKITLLYFSLLAIVTIPEQLMINQSIIGALTYFVLMVIFLVSIFKTVPLTADYTHFLVGRNALKDVLFIRTNRLISFVWAIVCLVQGIAAALMSNMFLSNFATMIPLVLWIPAVLFSLWFVKWYPANLAKAS
ncbi:flavodoxin family protein [Eubacteriaceae bacterium ES3]|nr:flavodoxin family protein [Eubacteriaceae bacterium ES3]